MSDPAARAVVSDDGSTIWLTAYTEAGDAVPVALLPVRAVALARELLTAAVPKLGNVTEENSVRPKGKRRGGDRQAQKRRQRDEDIRALAGLLSEGKPSEQAETIASRLARYSPMSEETSLERHLMQRINSSGLPVGADRIRKILGKQKTCLVAQTSPRD
jgi:hypothetical protein